MKVVRPLHLATDDTCAITAIQVGAEAIIAINSDQGGGEIVLDPSDRKALAAFLLSIPDDQP